MTFYWLYDFFESAVQLSTSYIIYLSEVSRHKIILFIAKRHCHIFWPSAFSHVELTEYWTSAPPRSNILSPPLDCSLMTNMWLLYFDNKYYITHSLVTACCVRKQRGRGKVTHVIRFKGKGNLLNSKQYKNIHLVISTQDISVKDFNLQEGKSRNISKS